VTEDPMTDAQTWIKLFQKYLINSYGKGFSILCCFWLNCNVQ